MLIESVAFSFLVACEVTCANECACVYSAGTVAHTDTSRASSASKIRKSTLPTAFRYRSASILRKTPMNNKNRFRHKIVPAVHRVQMSNRTCNAVDADTQKASTQWAQPSVGIYSSFTPRRAFFTLTLYFFLRSLFCSSNTQTEHARRIIRWIVVETNLQTKQLKNTILNICDRNLYCVNFFRIKLYTPPR